MHYITGNDAGRAFNTFPMMGDEWIPSEILDMEPKWRNFFENTATVQFDHRMLAMSSVAAVAATVLVARGGSKAAAGVATVTAGEAVVSAAASSVLPAVSTKALKAVVHMIALQVTLGISTLLLYVPRMVPAWDFHSFAVRFVVEQVTLLLNNSFAEWLSLQ